MLGFLLIYFIGKAFFDLAKNHNHSKWGYAILGVVSYYFGTFIAGFVVAIYLELYTETTIYDLGNLELSFIALPFGLLSCWLTYLLVKKIFTNAKIGTSENILDDDYFT
ncbi:MAG: hypothetical protein HKN51_12765 [Saprospiraceae bacterium]|nr:hypothetical protein [Bacteroidia bacterium]NNE15847.1 hypothetical protein [Saprospiraceae bacterium]